MNKTAVKSLVFRSSVAVAKEIGRATELLSTAKDRVVGGKAQLKEHLAGTQNLAHDVNEAMRRVPVETHVKGATAGALLAFSVVAGKKRKAAVKANDAKAAVRWMQADYAVSSASVDLVKKYGAAVATSYKEVRAERSGLS